MNLLTIEEYAIFLKREFEGVDPELVKGLFIEPFYLDRVEIKKVEQELKIASFPISFVDLIRKYDFGNLRINNTQFGFDDTGSLDWLLLKNNSEKFGHEEFILMLREQSLLVVATGDPFTIVMHIETGEIFALTAEIEVSKRLLVAASFKLFVEGMGTGFMAKRRKRLKEFLELVRAQFGEATLAFWKEASL